MRSSSLVLVILGVVALSCWIAGATYCEHRFDRVLYRMPHSRDSVAVVAGILCAAGNPGWGSDSCFETIETIKTIDRFGRTQFTDTLRQSYRPEGILDEVINPFVNPIHWAGVNGVRIGVSHTPSAPQWSDTDECLYFVMKRGAFVPITSWCRACEGEGRDGIVFNEWWGGSFALRIPARLQTDRGRNGLLYTPDPDPTGSGLFALEIPRVQELRRAFWDVNGEVTADPRARFRVRLFRSPIGDASDSLTVTPSSRIQIGRVLVEAEGDRGIHDPAGTFRTIEVHVRRLEVTVDGHHGYIEEDDYTHVGLWPAG